MILSTDWTRRRNETGGEVEEKEKEEQEDNSNLALSRAWDSAPTLALLHSTQVQLAQSQRYQPLLLSAVAALFLLLLVFLADSNDPLLPHPRPVVMTTVLSQFLDTSKAAFLADLATGKPLENWVISVGNEAGGTPPDGPALPLDSS